MFRTRISPSLFTVFSTLLLLFILVVPVAAGNDGQGNSGDRGFRALQGAEAAAFHIPADVQQTRLENLNSYGVRSARYQQFFNGAKVFGGQLSIYTDASGARLAVVGAHYPNILTTNQIRLNAGQAQAAVAKRPEATGGRFFTELLLDPASGRFFYAVESRAFDSRWIYWVDAESGEVFNTYNGLTDGTGIGVLGDSKDMTGLTTSAGGGFQLVSFDGRQTTYDAKNRNKLPGTLGTDSNDIWDTAGRTSPGQGALVDAQFYANVTDDYYLDVHNFDWIAFYPQGMVSSAHLQRNYANAYWNGEQMAYGDGDGVEFRELSGDLDVVGHELSHGVTEATSDLIYQNESGALNEAFSDIMGTSIEFSYGTGNWTIGEDIDLLSNGFRNMANPNEDGDPSHYADRYTGTGDNGGVHTNSGIANHWFYLLVNGGQNANPARATGTNVQDIGLSTAEQIAYLGFTALPAGANFCQARASTVAVAGSHSANVADAWDEVGVNDALCGGGGGGGGGDGPVISNAASAKIRGNSFEITWTTDVLATSEVTFTCCGTYTNTTLVTSHRMTFNGSKGVLYEFYVTSRDADGNATTEGPFTHQN
jgi:Zn-dependent metalloprotease